MEQKKQLSEEQFYRMFALPLRNLLQKGKVQIDNLQEIRLRVNNPILLYENGTEFSLTSQGRRTQTVREGYRIEEKLLSATLENLSGYSLYAFDEELKQGYLTVQGGHRVGVAGKVVTDEKKITCIRHITCLNIRISHEVIGCADMVLPYLVEDGTICHTLLISPPGCGKTTMLRDLIRQISDGTKYIRGQTVGVVDERSEIAGCWKGIPQNNLGIRTDILDCCPKAEGMMMLLRAMAPEVIAVDELGDRADSEAVGHVFRCGCRLIATVHGSSLEEVYQKPMLQEMIQDQMFERFVLLQKDRHGKHRASVFRADGELLWDSGYYDGE